MSMFPIKFETNFVKTTTKRVFVQHTIGLDDFLMEFVDEQWVSPADGGSYDDDPEANLAKATAKWNALTADQQTSVIEKWKDNHGFTINGHDNYDQDENHLECYDDESDDDFSVLNEVDCDDVCQGVREDVWDHQSTTWAHLADLFSTPEEREAKQVSDLEASIKKADDEFLASAELLKSQFMKQMAILREQTEKRQEVSRKALADLRMAKLTSV
jgi:hypothetical protein